MEKQRNWVCRYGIARGRFWPPAPEGNRAAFFV
jgi:hypothetical protein